MCNSKEHYCRLSDQELLGKIVSEESAGELMQKYHDLEGILLKTYQEELKNVRGVGDRKSEMIGAIGEAVNRILEVRKNDVKIIESPKDIYLLNKDISFQDQEEIRVVLLNVKNRVIRTETVTIGTVSSSLVSPREIYSRAVRAMASGIVMVHNHPSGNPEPSKDDKEITTRLIAAGKALSISLLDHIIIGRGSFVSMKRDCDLDWN